MVETNQNIATQYIEKQHFIQTIDDNRYVSKSIKLLENYSQLASLSIPVSLMIGMVAITFENRLLGILTIATGIICSILFGRLAYIWRENKKKWMTLRKTLKKAGAQTSLQIINKLMTIHEFTITLSEELQSLSRKYANIRHVVLITFPNMIQEYLKLPQEYAENHIQEHNGKTAEEELLQNLQEIQDRLQIAISEVRQQQTKHISEQIGGIYSRPENQSIVKMEQTFSRLERNSLPMLPSEIKEQVLQIMAYIKHMLPKLVKKQSLGDMSGYEMERIALKYLPKTIEKYLDYPSDFAMNQPFHNGKTAYNLLLEQLELLDNTIYKMMMDTYNEDMDGLVQHGYFLKEKFAGDYFEVFHREDKENTNIVL